MRSGLCHSSSSTPTLANPVFMDLTLCTRDLSCHLGLLASVKSLHYSIQRHLILLCDSNMVATVWWETRILVWWSGVCKPLAVWCRYFVPPFTTSVILLQNLLLLFRWFSIWTFLLAKTWVKITFTSTFKRGFSAISLHFSTEILQHTHERNYWKSTFPKLL